MGIYKQDMTPTRQRYMREDLFFCAYLRYLWRSSKDVSIQFDKSKSKKIEKYMCTVIDRSSIFIFFLNIALIFIHNV